MFLSIHMDSQQLAVELWEIENMKEYIVYSDQLLTMLSSVNLCLIQSKLIWEN